MSSGFLLPMEPRGIYREMLTQAWYRNARLPNDAEKICRIIGATEDEWGRCWPIVKRFWRVTDDGGWLVNDTQLEIYNDALLRSANASEKARRAAQARYGKGPKLVKP